MGQVETGRTGHSSGSWWCSSSCTSLEGALLPIIVSIIVAELLFPVVSFMERRLPGHKRYPRFARLFTIAIIYLAILAIAASLLFLTIQPIVKEVQDFIETAPQIAEEARETIEISLEEFDRRVPDDVKAQLEEWLGSASGAIGSAALSLLTRTISGVTGTVSLVIGLAIVPFLLFYMLKDKEELLGRMYSVLPESVARHTHNVLALFHGVVGSYVRAQLISASIVGGLVFLGLVLLDISFALTLGLLAGALGLIPIIGAYIGAVPGLLVALATDPGKLVWVALLYIVVQFIESNIVSPRIQGSALILHPIFIMGTLVIASDIAGLLGVLVGVPLVAVARDIFVYFYKEWSGPGESEAEPEEVEETDTTEVAAEGLRPRETLDSATDGARQGSVKLRAVERRASEEPCMTASERCGHTWECSRPASCRNLDWSRGDVAASCSIHLSAVFSPVTQAESE